MAEVSFPSQVLRGCGIDVHLKVVVATIKGEGIRKETRSFDTFTSSLTELKEWLLQNGITHVAMESTGVYWKPVYHVLEDAIPNVWIVNARHIKNVPGHKTDKMDSEWICKLLLAGLLKPSYIPPKEQRQLRDLTRYRNKLIQHVSSEKNRMQRKLLYLLCFVFLTIPACVTAQVGIDEFSEKIQKTLLSYNTNKQMNKFLKTAKKQNPEIEKATLKIPIYSLYINKKHRNNHDNADSLFVYLNTQKAYINSVFVSSGDNHMIIDGEYKNRREQFVDRGKRAIRLEKIIKEREIDYVLIVAEDINNCIMVGRNNVLFYNYDLQKGYILCDPSHFVREFDSTITYLDYRPSPIYYAK